MGDPAHLHLIAHSKQVNTRRCITDHLNKLVVPFEQDYDKLT
jgi:hypothetical protein